MVGLDNSQSERFKHLGLKAVGAAHADVGSFCSGALENGDYKGSHGSTNGRAWCVNVCEKIAKIYAKTMRISSQRWQIAFEAILFNSV